MRLPTGPRLNHLRGSSLQAGRPQRSRPLESRYPAPDLSFPSKMGGVPFRLSDLGVLETSPHGHIADIGEAFRSQQLFANVPGRNAHTGITAQPDRGRLQRRSFELTGMAKADSTERLRNAFFLNFCKTRVASTQRIC
jgi:hypothetical protein